MYILAVKEGYIQITIDTDTGKVFLIEEDEAGLDYKLTIDGEERTVKIIPVGSIAISTFNKNWNRYLEAGGTSKISPLNGDRTISLTSPVPPFWPFSGNKSDDMTINEVADRLYKEAVPFRSVSYLPFNGGYTPVFEVEELEDLYFYDRYRLQEAGIKVKQCEDCGRAFIPNTQAVRCKACRDAGMGERKKRQNLENEPGMITLKNIRERNRYNRKKLTDCTTQQGDSYFIRLCKVIDLHTDGIITPEQREAFANHLNDLDKRYFKLCKYFQKPYQDCDYESLPEIVKEWLAEKTQFPQDEIEDMQQWIEKWESKK